MFVENMPFIPQQQTDIFSFISYNSQGVQCKKTQQNNRIEVVLFFVCEEEKKSATKLV